MNKLFRGCLIAMILLLALGVALLVHGALRHVNRPLLPPSPGGGSVRYAPAWSVAGHV